MWFVRGSREPKPYYRLLPKQNSLTYILGARCKDGVVLVADRKVVHSNSGEENYEPKLFPLGNPVSVVWGAAGVQAFYDSFTNRVKVRIQKHDRVSWERFRIFLEEAYEDMNKIYGSLFTTQLNVIIAQRPKIRSELWLIDGIGSPQRIRKFRAIGTGAKHGTVFIQHFWDAKNGKLDMREVAEIGYFTVRYIETLKLDRFVGVGSLKPQVWFVPDNFSKRNSKGDYGIRRAEKTELGEMEDLTKERLKRFREGLANFWAG